MVMRAKVKADKAQKEHAEAWFELPAPEAQPIKPSEAEDAITKTGV